MFCAAGHFLPLRVRKALRKEAVFILWSDDGCAKRRDKTSALKKVAKQKAGLSLWWWKRPEKGVNTTGFFWERVSAVAPTHCALRVGCASVTVRTQDTGGNNGQNENTQDYKQGQTVSKRSRGGILSEKFSPQNRNSSARWWNTRKCESWACISCQRTQFLNEFIFSTAQRKIVKFRKLSIVLPGRI